MAVELDMRFAFKFGKVHTEVVLVEHMNIVLISHYTQGLRISYCEPLECVWPIG